MPIKTNIELSTKRPANPKDDILLCEKHLAKMFGCSVRKLQKDRQKNIGPEFIKLGKMVRYRMSDVERYLASNTVTTLNPGVM